MEARPLVIRPDGYVLGGNMRLRALSELGWKDAPVVVATGWSDDQAQQFLIKDNVAFGDWDWDVLANEWENADLNNWGLNVWDPRADAVEESNAEEGEWTGMPDFETAPNTFKLLVEFDTKEELEGYVNANEIPIIKKVPTAWSARYPFDGKQDLGSLKYE